jgi:spermidine synthase
MNFLSDIDAILTPTDWVLGLLACVVAVGTGIWMAKKQTRAFSGDAAVQCHSNFPAATIAEYGDMRFLHLGSPAVQGSMKISAPFDIHLEYVQRMMVWLLWVDLNQVKHLHAMQLGLGAAALTKFCHHHLDMLTTAVELNPQVIDTCKRWFKLPENNTKLNVMLGDAGDAAKKPDWQGKIDALQVDLYDQDAAQPVIDTEVFYRNCRNLLTEQGCMVVNLFGRAMSYTSSLQKIKAAFGEDAIWAFKPTTAGNIILLAFRTPRTFDRDLLQQKSQAVQARWPLPAEKWLKTLAPI